ncbi:uncharacterized protein LOC123313228 isoform X1 [Coccinella septempunctata]|uniref:uncharacterized protein LOC123313228 isoform X1 n=1 Tax=Coccinella septempunctata TaxID=41139 RepID=UPI001D077FF0|nr:uncharacterized protein LOC123313228 isoform X1 [Coccinella septempunctata]
MLMTRYSLRFRRLLQQYCRIETDRLTYIRRNQSKLRSEKYIHSRDAITTEGAANVEHHVFGDTRCWMYSIEGQKRGLPHAHILIWLVERIRPEQIDDVVPRFLFM